MGKAHYSFITSANIGTISIVTRLVELETLSSGVCICKSEENDLKHGNYTCKSDENCRLEIFVHEYIILMKILTYDCHINKKYSHTINKKYSHTIII
jgi:hypothetical protein